MLSYDHLVGRDYIPGEVHCYSLVRDFYAHNFDIHFRNYVIPHNYDARQFDLIEKTFEREGTFKVADWNIRKLNPGDIMAVCVRSARPNHLCLYVGDNTILHHPYGALSRTEMLRDFWRQNTAYILRHPDVNVEVPAKPTTSIQDIISGRYFPQAASEAAG